jgi:hypothetical protein
MTNSWRACSMPIAEKAFHQFSCRESGYSRVTGSGRAPSHCAGPTYWLKRAPRLWSHFRRVKSALKAVAQVRPPSCE